MISTLRCFDDHIQIPRMVSTQFAAAVSLLAAVEGAFLFNPRPPTARGRVLAASCVSMSANAAADGLLQACAGLDRGIIASVDDVERVTAAVEAFEGSAPCSLSGDSLAMFLSGQWRLVYSSSLSGAAPLSTDEFMRFAATLVDAPMARSSQLAIGEVTQIIDGFGADLRMEEAVSLRLRTPWPLPQAPELTIKLTSALDASDVSAGAGQLSSSLLDVGVQLAGTVTPPLPTSSLLDSITSALASPPLAPLREFQTKASSTAVTAASETVRVDRCAAARARRATASPAAHLVLRCLAFS